MDLESMRRFRNERNLFGKQLGIEVTELLPGFARVVKTVGPEDVNPLGVPHGGIYFSMADTACGSAMTTHGYMAVTVNSSFSFFRGAKVGDVLTGEAREIKSGRTICVFQAQITDQNGTLLAGGDFTFFRLDKKLPE